MRRYRNSSRGRDPYWTTARFNSTDKSGAPVKKGDRIFYYPNTKTVLTGEAAERASREFDAAKQDEDFMGGDRFLQEERYGW